MAQEKAAWRVVRMSAIGNVVKNIHSPLNAGAYARRINVLEDVNDMESGVCIRRPYFLDQCRPARFAWHLLPNPTLPSTLALLFIFTELNLLMYTYPPLVPQSPNLTSASCVHVTPHTLFRHIPPRAPCQGHPYCTHMSSAGST